MKVGFLAIFNYMIINTLTLYLNFMLSVKLILTLKCIN